MTIFPTFVTSSYCSDPLRVGCVVGMSVAPVMNAPMAVWATTPRLPGVGGCRAVEEVARGVRDRRSGRDGVAASSEASCAPRRAILASQLAYSRW